MTTGNDNHVTCILTRLQAHVQDLEYVVTKTKAHQKQVYKTWLVNELEYVLACVAVLEELKFIDFQPQPAQILTKAQNIITQTKHTSRTEAQLNSNLYSQNFCAII